MTFSQMIYHLLPKCHDLLLMLAMDTGGECGACVFSFGSVIIEPLLCARHFADH